MSLKGTWLLITVKEFIILCLFEIYDPMSDLFKYIFFLPKVTEQSYCDDVSITLMYHPKTTNIPDIFCLKNESVVKNNCKCNFYLMTTAKF